MPAALVALRMNHLEPLVVDMYRTFRSDTPRQRPADAAAIARSFTSV